MSERSADRTNEQDWRAWSAQLWTRIVRQRSATVYETEVGTSVSDLITKKKIILLFI